MNENNYSEDVYVMISAMVYLSVIHIWRMLLQEDTYVIDISGPLMLATIKITYVGYGIHDGKLSDEERNENTVLMKKKPTLLEYLGYIFNFSSVFCGPPMEYQDYMDFIEGTEFDDYEEKLKDKHPSPLIPSLKKFVLGYIAVAIYGLISANFDPKLYGEKSLLEDSSLLYKVFFAEMVVYHHKFKYMSAFVIGESICNAAGCGFSGVENDGAPKWDKLKTMKPYSWEVGTNLREYVDSWNLITNQWLKKCIYSRLTVFPFLGTWVFSAIWHGFYPGYYTFFIPLGAALFITRKVRRKIRPYFLVSKQTKFVYDIITAIVTRLLIGFYAVGFATLNLSVAFRFWRSVHHYGHYIIFAGAILICILPDVPRSQHHHGDHHHNNNHVKDNGFATNGHSNGLVSSKEKVS